MFLFLSYYSLHKGSLYKYRILDSSTPYENFSVKFAIKFSKFSSFAARTSFTFLMSCHSQGGQLFWAQHYQSLILPHGRFGQIYVEGIILAQHFLWSKIALQVCHNNKILGFIISHKNCTTMNLLEALFHRSPDQSFDIFSIAFFHYLNVRNFRVQKISRIGPFAKFRVFWWNLISRI